MKKPLPSVLLCFALLLTLTTTAQKNKVPRPSAARQNTAERKKIEEAPPELEKLEDTKIDVVTPALPDLDTTAAPDDALTGEIIKLLDESNAVALGVSVAENMLLQQKAANTDQKMDAFYTKFLKTFKSERVYGLLKNIFVKAYREVYTLNEIKQLTDFYKTPVGKKTLTTLPGIMQKTQQQCSQLGVILATEVYKQPESDQ